MKPLIASHVSVLLMLVSGNAALAIECSLATLKGRYIYYTQGLDQSGEAYGEAGTEIYDGAGNFTSTSVNTKTGQRNVVTGTYIVAPDCTGEAVYPDGTYAYFLHPDGSRFTWVSTGQNRNAGEEIRVSK